jgi:hypothetical protein
MELKILDNYFYKLDNLKDIEVIWKKYNKANILEIGINYPTAIVDLERLSGIPLTKEWLLNLGFNKDVDGSFMKNDISIFLDKRFKTNLFLQENQDNFKWFSYECKIKYVHQLQNLYFALTGDELTITK